MKYLTSLLLCLLLTACQSSNRPELHIFMWSNYIKPEIIAKFEERYQCKVILDTYDSNEAMYAKLKLGATGYDLIFPSHYIFNLMVQQDMIQSLDFSKLQNYQDIDPLYLKRIPQKAIPYGVPYMISMTGIAYRSDRITSPELSWKVFGMKAYKGRMTMLNDIREALGAALKSLNYSINTQQQSEIEAAADVLINWKNYLAKFESEQYKNGLASAEYLLVQGYNGDILQIMQENPNIGFFYPEEGTLMSMDYLCIPKKAPNEDLAHKFINFLLEGEIAAENISHTFFLSPNLKAYPLLPQQLRENKALFPTADILSKSEMIDDVGSAYTYYVKAWNRVKSN